MLKTKIVSIVDDFVSEDKVFSAFDITTEIRNSGIDCRHHAMKHEIHNVMKDVMTQIDYNRTLVDTGKYVTFIYHPEGVDPSDYGKKTTTTTKTTSTSTTTSTSGAVCVKRNFTDSKTVDSDGRGRVCIPSHMITKLGLLQGDIVVVRPMIGCDTVEIRSIRTCTNSEPHDRCYTVDRDNNIRISPSVLRQANIDNTQVTVNVAKPVIVIS